MGVRDARAPERRMAEPGANWLDYAPGPSRGPARPWREGVDDGEGAEFLSFRLDGRRLLATLYEDRVVLDSPNGEAGVMSVPRLHFCPECVRSGRFPFAEDGGECARHHVPFLDYDREAFERFELLAQM